MSCLFPAPGVRNRIFFIPLYHNNDKEMTDLKPATTDREATGANLPESFARYTRAMMGDALYGRFAEALTEEPPVSIRLNPLKCGGSVAGGERVPWCAEGWWLKERPAFTFDPLLHAGWYYVQEASSMLVAHVLRRYVHHPVTMLDLCAAPGGKSTAARAALPEGSVLMSNEPVRLRAHILAENMAKWGHPGVIVTNNYPKDYARSGLTFDVILCDVPCSGEGMFRKDEGAVGEWSAQNVSACRDLQREIVAEAWSCLRPGGIMIYSTCTFNTHENEENVAWACTELGAEVLPADIGADWNITGSLLEGFDRPVCRFIPGVTRGEGLFMAVLRKGGDGAAEGRRKARSKGAKARRPTAKVPTEWLAEPERFVMRQEGEALMALPEEMAAVYDTAAASLRILSAGVTACYVKGRDIIPAHALALSAALGGGAFPRVGLTYAEAIAYLRRETVTLPADTPRGYVLVTFGGAVLGFAKHIGNRTNNMYPQEWRIKSTHVPEQPEIIIKTTI